MPRRLLHLHRVRRRRHLVPPRSVDLDQVDPSPGHRGRTPSARPRTRARRAQAGAPAFPTHRPSRRSRRPVVLGLGISVGGVRPVGFRLAHVSTDSRQSPESLLGAELRSKEQDLWNLGMLAFCLPSKTSGLPQDPKLPPKAPADGDCRGGLLDTASGSHSDAVAAGLLHRIRYLLGNPPRPRSTSSSRCFPTAARRKPGPFWTGRGRAGGRSSACGVPSAMQAARREDWSPSSRPRSSGTRASGGRRRTCACWTASTGSTRRATPRRRCASSDPIWFPRIRMLPSQGSPRRTSRTTTSRCSSASGSASCAAPPARSTTAAPRPSPCAGATATSRSCCASTPSSPSGSRTPTSSGRASTRATVRGLWSSCVACWRRRGSTRGSRASA